MPTGIPGSGKNGKRPRRKVKRRRPQEASFIAPDLTRAETKVLYRRLSTTPRTKVSVREGAAVSSLLAKITEAVIARE